MKSNDPYMMDSCKLKFHPGAIHNHYVLGKKIPPINIDVGLTKACNAKCVYCYGNKQVMANDIMPWNVTINLFKDAPRLGVKSMTITGDGEPTLNPALKDALIYGHQGGLDIGLATNGILLDSNLIYTILGTCTWCRINISAHDRQSYKSVHGVDCWEKVQANITQMVKIKNTIGSKCTIGLQMVYLPECVNYVIPEAKWAIDLGLDYFVVKQYSQPGCESMSDFDLKWYDSADAMWALYEAQELSNEQTRIIIKWDRIDAKGVRPFDRCVDCALIFQISGNSKCYPCGYLFNDERYCYGNLKVQTLEEILTSQHYWDIVHYMREEFDVHTQCTGECRHSATCEYIWDFLNKPKHLNFI